MENEVSGIAKLGIVLIALAILIGLGFGIFQISKSVANDGVGQVQGELDSVGASKYSTYDQKNITGTMVSSALSDFEGENTAVLIATQAWKDALANTSAIGTGKDLKTGLVTGGVSAGIGGDGGAYKKDAALLPLVKANKSDGKTLTWNGSGTVKTITQAYFINYNALLGAAGTAGATGLLSDATIGTTLYKMGAINFKGNCYEYSGPFATDESGKVAFNNIITNVSKSGMTEYISSAAKFNSNLIKDASGTTMGIAMEQIGG